MQKEDIALAVSIATLVVNTITAWQNRKRKGRHRR